MAQIRIHDIHPITVETTTFKRRIAERPRARQAKRKRADVMLGVAGKRGLDAHQKAAIGAAGARVPRVGAANGNWITANVSSR